MTEFSVGQKLFVVAPRFQAIETFEVTIEKVGRKYITAKRDAEHWRHYAFQFHIETLQENTSFRPAQAYLNRSAYYDEIDLRTAWEAFKQAYRAVQYGPVPKFLTLDEIEQMTFILKPYTPEATL